MCRPSTRTMAQRLMWYLSPAPQWNVPSVSLPSTLLEELMCSIPPPATRKGTTNAGYWASRWPLNTDSRVDSPPILVEVGTRPASTSTPKYGNGR